MGLAARSFQGRMRVENLSLPPASGEHGARG